MHGVKEMDGKDFPTREFHCGSASGCRRAYRSCVRLVRRSVSRSHIAHSADLLLIILISFSPFPIPSLTAYISFPPKEGPFVSLSFIHSSPRDTYSCPALSRRNVSPNRSLSRSTERRVFSIDLHLENLFYNRGRVSKVSRSLSLWIDRRVETPNLLGSSGASFLSLALSVRTSSL